MTTHPAAADAVVPVVLLILDGVGCRDNAPDNAVTRAEKPNWNRLWREHPHTTIDASELAVGLPRGQMGNSEVGHLNIGAGRVIYQEFTRIDRAIETGEFARNPALVDAVATARQNRARLHVLGLVSPGGVHSHEKQIAAMVAMAADGGAPRVAVHAFLDGRDTPPRSAGASLRYLSEACAAHDDCRIADIVGRYYAMDRDQRWERIEAAYKLIVDADAPYSAPDAAAALAAAYARGENDDHVLTSSSVRVAAPMSVST
jgi:2,3-bisphosphoglycerate-independent phosphoglycerate mutase